MNARSDRYGTWLLWLAIVVIGVVLLSSAAYLLTSRADYSTLGGPIGSHLYLPGFDPWTGQPFSVGVAPNGGGLVRVEPLPDAFVGRWAIPIPVGLVVGCVIMLVALVILRPTNVVMAAIVSLLAPVAALPIVIFTDHKTPCPAGADHPKDAIALCGSRVLETVDPIVWQAALAALGIAWLVATVALVMYVVRIDPRGLVRSSAVVAFLAVLAAGAGFMMGTNFMEDATQPRLRLGVQVGMQSFIALLLVGMIVVIVRAAITARAHPRT